MPSAAATSQGCKLQSDNGSGTYATIAEIHTFGGPNETAKQIDVTSLDSTAREYIGGLADAGEVTMEGNFVGNNAKQQALYADMMAGTKRLFKLLLADAGTPTTISFTAVVVAFGIKGSVDNQVTFNATLKITGAPSWSYAT